MLCKLRTDSLINRCARDVIQLILQALIAVCVVHLTTSVSFSQAARMVPDCMSVNGAHSV